MEHFCRNLICILGIVALVSPSLSYANPVGGAVSAGSASINSSGNVLTVKQSTDKAVIDWRGFDINTGEVTRFQDPSSNSITLNRVNSVNPSKILGTLTSNGQMVLINPNGLFFGKNAVVDVSGITATTANISNSAFMAGGKMAFASPGADSGFIDNEGTITAKDMGLVTFVAPNVVNNGVITAKLGHVALASGDTATLDLAGDGLLSVAVSKGSLPGQVIANNGVIAADGGTVKLTAAAARDIVNSLITNTGVIEATSQGKHNGSIELYAEGSNAVKHNVKANKAIKQGSSAVLNSGVFDASGTAPGQTGGTVTVTGDNVALLSGSVIDASGDAGGGTVKIGGDFHGQGNTPTAKHTIVQSGTTVKANALTYGNGGNVTVWADGRTDFAGTIEAKGGSVSGDGGYVETSGKQILFATGLVDASAPHGNAGTWLLDPNNITIQASGSDTNVSGNPSFTSTDDSAIVTTGSIQTALNAGTSVMITTGSGGANSQGGDINLNSGISKTAGGDATLTLSAFGNIVVNGYGDNITSTAGKLNVVFDSDNGGNHSGAIDFTGGNENITTNGGNITMGGGILSGGLPSGAAWGNATYTSGIITGVGGAGVWNAGGGNIALSGTGYTANGISAVSSLQTSGNGSITLIGIGAGQYGGGAGVATGNMSAVNGNITVTGSGNTSTTGGSYLGVQIGGTIQTTGSGNINITGTGGNGSGGGNSGITTAYGAPIIKATGGGSITLTGIKGAGNSNGIDTSNAGSGTIVIGDALQTGNITVVTDNFLFGSAVPTFNTSGKAIFAPNTASTTIGVAGGAGTLGITSTLLGNINSRVSEIDIGSTADTGALTANAYTWANPVKLITGSGIITLGGNQALGANNFTLQSDTTPSFGTSTITSTGAVGILPASVGTTVGFSGGAGTLQITQAMMNLISAPTINIGRIDSTGLLTTGAYTWASGLTTLNLYGGNITDSGNITMAQSGTNNLNLYSAQNIIINNAITASTGLLNITLDADDAGTSVTNAAGTTSGYINVAANLTSNGGNITLGGGSAPATGYAWGNAGQSAGVSIAGSSSGTVTLYSNTGNVIVNGHGYNNPSGGYDYGVYMRNWGYSGNGNSIQATTGNVTVNGLGGTGNATGSNYGTYLYGSSISTTSGAISVTGTGGADSGGGNTGVFLSGQGGLSSTTSNAALGAITISGTGGTGGGSNSGVVLAGLSSYYTGISSNAATISITGTGGAGTSSNVGSYFGNQNNITTTSGVINITGTGGAGANTAGYINNYGVFINGSTIGSTGASTASGAITITGTGANGYNFDDGVHYVYQSISTAGGNLLINGYGGNDASGISSGIYIDNNPIASSGSGNITLQGVGGHGGSGLYFDSYLSYTSTIGGSSDLGNISLIADNITFSGTPTIQTQGKVSFTPYTSSTTVGVAGGSGTLNLTTSFLNKIIGVSEIDIGSTADTGALTANAYTWANPVKLITGSGLITLGGNQTLGANNFTLQSDTTPVFGSSTITSSGTVSILPASAGTTIGVNGSAGTLQVTTAMLNAITASNVTIGRADGSGLMRITGADLSAGGYNLNLINGSGGIQFDGGATNLKLGTNDNLTATTASGNITSSANGGIVTSGSGGITLFSGNDLTFANALNLTAGGTGAVLLKANDSIIESGSGNITTQGGAITLDADADASGAGAISLTGDTLASNGGNITLGGGATPTSVAAYGTAANINGVTNNATLNAGGGNISILGDGYASTNGAFGVSNNGTIQTSGTGTITITGIGFSTGGGGYGFSMNSGLITNSGSGLTSISGTGTLASGSSQRGFFMTGGSITNTGSGDITLTAIQGYGSRGFYLVPGSFYNMFSTNTGTLTFITPTSFYSSNLGIGGASENGNIVFKIGFFDTNNPTVQTSKNLTIKPYTSGTTIGIGTGTGTLSISDAVLGNLSYGSLTIGDSVTAGAIDFNDSGRTFSAPLTLASSGNVTLDSKINSSYAGTALVLAAGGNFINNAGSNPLNLTGSGANWDIYSTQASSDTNGAGSTGLVAAYYTGNTTYTATPPGSLAHPSSNNWVYSTAAPNTNVGTITITASDQTVTYGTAPNLLSVLGTTYTCSGTGSACSDISGAAALSISNSVTTSTSGNYNAGTWTGDILSALGSLAFNAGYSGSFSFVNGTLSVLTKALSITGITAGNKAYDGGTVASLGTGSAGLSGKVAGDLVTLGTGSASGTFASQNAANNIAVTASGFALAGADKANYTLTQPTGLAANITKVALTVTADDATKQYGQVNPSFSDTITGFVNSENATSAGITGSATLATAATQYSSVAGGPYAITAAANNLAATNYSFQYANAPTGLTVTAAPLTITADAKTATYGGLVPTLTYNSSSLLNGDTLSGALTTAHGGAATAISHANGLDVGTYGITQGTLANSNYAITFIGANLAVAAKGLSITGFTAGNKTYDATTAATITSDGSLSGTVAGDAVSLNNVSASASFSDKNVANGKTVTAVGYALSGAQSSDYTLGNQPTATANITPAVLTVTANSQTKTYGDTFSLLGTEFTHSALQGGETVGSVSFASTGAAATASVAGGPYAITPSAATGGTFDPNNYTINYVNGSMTLNAKNIILASGVTANNKIYDATATDTLNIVSPTFTGIVNSDTVTLDSSGYSAAFADKNVANGKAVTVAGLALSGSGASNYALTQPIGLMANITPYGLTVSGITADNKVYDTTTAAVVHTAGDSLVGVFGGDTVSLNNSGVSGAFADKNVANGKAVTVTGLALTAGGDSGNYTITGVSAPVTANITPYGLTVSGLTASNKVYDATTADTLGGTAAITALSGDTVSLSGTATGTFNNKNVANGKAVTTSGLILAGADSGNYTLAQQTGLMANITPASLSITASAVTGTYGTSAANTLNNVTGFTSTGLVAGETIGSVSLTDNASLSGSGNKNAGSFNITPSAATGGTFDANNYTVSYTNGLLTVNKATLTITGVSGANKIYDGTTSAAIAGTSALSGVASGVNNGGGTADTVALSNGTASFASADVANGKTVSFSGYTVSGADANNYTLSQPANSTANITPAALSLTANNQNKSFGTTFTFAGTEFTVSGLQNNETIGAATLSSAGAASGATIGGSPYAIAISNAIGGTFNPNNYTITYNNGVMNVVAGGTITITAHAVSSVYGTAPTLNYTFACSDNCSSSVVTGALGTNATASTSGNYNVGSWNITQGTLSDTNSYLINFNPALFTVTPAALSVVGITAGNKIYDATTSVVLNTASAVLSGKITNDVVNFDTGSIAGSFANSDAANGKTVTTSGITLNGTDSGNYALTQPTATANITPKSLTVTGVSANAKTYDGLTNASLNTSADTLSGIVIGDNVLLSNAGVAGAFNDANVGNGKAITTSGFAISGAQSSNYSLVQPLGVIGNITPAHLTITANDQTSVSGTAIPTLTDVITGFVNSETRASTLTGLEALSTTATSSSPANNYAIAAAIGTLAANHGNYDFTFVNGTLTVNAGGGGGSFGGNGLSSSGGNTSTNLGEGNTSGGGTTINSSTGGSSGGSTVIITPIPTSFTSAQLPNTVQVSLAQPATLLASIETPLADSQNIFARLGDSIAHGSSDNNDSNLIVKENAFLQEQKNTNNAHTPLVPVPTTSLSSFGNLTQMGLLTLSPAIAKEYNLCSYAGGIIDSCGAGMLRGY